MTKYYKLFHLANLTLYGIFFITTFNLIKSLYCYLIIQGVPEWSVQTLWISSRDLNKQKMSHKHGVGNACFWSYDGSKFSCNSWGNYHVKSHRCYKTVFIYFLGFATDITGQYTCYSKCSKRPPLDSKEACARRRIVWRTVHYHRHGHTPDGYPPVHQTNNLIHSCF